MGAVNFQKSFAQDSIILIRGAGEMASGVAHKLVRCGFKVVLTEMERPLAIRRGVAFAEAIFSDIQTIEGVEARRVVSREEATSTRNAIIVPIIIDPGLTHTLPLLRYPQSVVVDARMLKRPVSEDYPANAAVIGLGPGFTAPTNAQFVIETNRGHHLGRVIEEGSAESNTGIPAEIQGATRNRVVYSPACGEFHSVKMIGDPVQAGDIIGYVDTSAVTASLGGVLRGLLHEGIPVTPEIKIADIDPRGNREHCFLISDKARAIAGGVLEAVLRIQGNEPKKR